MSRSRDWSRSQGPCLVGGLLSGTSMDGIDALLLRVEGDDPGALAWEVVAFDTFPWAEELREGMRRAMSVGGTDARGLVRLHVELGQGFADAFLQLLETTGTAPDEVAALGSHGQTIWHEPPSGASGSSRAGARGWTLQLGDAATLAERTGIAVIHDFRARDMAAGGHGAPLVPWADRVLLHRPGVGRALQNLGGMGNVTFLPASGAWDEILAFDTGPGVALVDAAFRRAEVALGSTGGPGFDVDGRRAARGRVDEAILAGLLADPFFDMPPPRSTGRERFGDARLEALLSELAPRFREADTGAWDDLLATLVELTARSVARAYRDHLPVAGIHQVVLAGGGARNPTLVRAIEGALSREIGAAAVETGAAALGVDPDAREAAAFALLAWAHLRGIPGSLPRVTGAAGPRVLGSYVPGAGRGSGPGAAG